MTSNGKSPSDKKFWLDDKKNVDRIWYGVVIGTVALCLADFFYHKHFKFEIEGLPGFYGIYGFLICVVLVFAVKLLRKILRRDENYYGDQDD